MPDIESVAHAGRLPGEETWKCERCGRIVDPLSRFYEDDNDTSPYCHYCAEELDRKKHEEDDKGDAEEQKEEAEHWVKVEEVLQKIWEEL